MTRDRTRVDYFFDPVCPFCWMTSKWVRQVQATGYPLDVTWQFISLAILNEENEQAGSDGHQRGLALLRIADAIKEAAGNDGVAAYYEAIGNRLWETAPEGIEGPLDQGEQGKVVGEHQASVAEDVRSVLSEIGLDPDLAEAAEDESRDAELRKWTEEALRRTGPDVGTPIISFDPPNGSAFFGPVISSLADDDRSVELWKALETLAYYPSMAELKRSLRDTPDIALLRAVSGG